MQTNRAPTVATMKIRPVRLNTSIAALFMVGSACFAIGAAPAYVSAAGTTADLVTFVIGSVFFTCASFSQLVQAQSPALAPAGPTRDRVPARAVLRAWLPHDRAWVAAAVQFPGTLFFNVTTSAALIQGLSVAEMDRQVWRPDFFGSVLFLVSSGFALAALEPGSWRAWRPLDLAWVIAWLNMLGSAAFMVSALASYVLPTTGGYLNSAWSDAGTFAGAVCFFLGAALMVPLWRRLTSPR